MTVEELIALLQSVPKDLKVKVNYFCDDSYYDMYRTIDADDLIVDGNEIRINVAGGDFSEKESE